VEWICVFLAACLALSLLGNVAQGLRNSAIRLHHRALEVAWWHRFLEFRRQVTREYADPGTPPAAPAPPTLSGWLDEDTVPVGRLCRD
jgi:hypothetical protein